jgi:hypothetical protein
MKKLMLSALLLGSSAFANPIIIGANCRIYTPDGWTSGSLLTRIEDRRHPNYGSLLWPSGNFFMVRHRSLRDDRSLFYPDGSPFVLRTRMRDDNTVLWPWGNTFVLRNRLRDDGTVFHSNGSVWLLRQRGRREDRERFGFPVEDVRHGDYRISATLNPNDGVRINVIMEGLPYKLQVIHDSESEQTLVQECIE